MIKARNIIKSYQNGESRFQVLKDISLDIEDNDFVVILGASGSGSAHLGLSPLPAPLHLKDDKARKQNKGTYILRQQGKEKQDGKEPTPARVGTIFDFQRGKFFFHIHSPCRGAALFLAFSAPILLQDSEFCKGGGFTDCLHLHRQRKVATAV